MIGVLARISWLNLSRDYVALGLTFVLPIVFFSIFAMIFGSMSFGGGGSGSMKVIVVDEDDTETSRRFVKAVDGFGALRVYSRPVAAEGEPEPEPYDRETARLRRYLETLGTEGPAGVTTKRERFGLSLRQLAEVTDALSMPLNAATRGVPPAQILQAARGRTTLRILVEPDAKVILDHAEPAIDEVQGLTLGTALAAVLGRDGLVLKPHKPRGTSSTELPTGSRKYSDLPPLDYSTAVSISTP